MPLSPTFSLTPRNPSTASWNSEIGDYNHYATLHCLGVFLGAYHNDNLNHQYDHDKARLKCIGINIPAPITMPDLFWKHSVALLGFKTKATTEDQYLLIFHVRGMYGARAAFYINGNLVRSEEVDGDETIAILVDCPAPQTWWWVYMFCEGTEYIPALELKEIECHIL